MAAHKWQRIHHRAHPFGLLAGPVRQCELCGKFQNYSLVSYNVMQGSTYRWRPLVGKCPGSQVSDEVAGE